MEILELLCGLYPLRYNLTFLNDMIVKLSAHLFTFAIGRGFVDQVFGVSKNVLKT